VLGSFVGCISAFFAGGSPLDDSGTEGICTDSDLQDFSVTDTEELPSPAPLASTACFLMIGKAAAAEAGLFLVTTL
jgi:hypothetical protein